MSFLFYTHTLLSITLAAMCHRVIMCSQLMGKRIYAIITPNSPELVDDFG